MLIGSTFHIAFLFQRCPDYSCLFFQMNFTINLSGSRKIVMAFLLGLNLIYKLT